MQIKNIRLLNWQAHSNLELNFSDGLNIITGLSDAGKSCIRRAIDWICFNLNISEIDFRKEGTDLTSVTIGLNNDFEVERVRSDNLNRYILRKEGCEDKVFDSIGKEIPEEVKQVLSVDLIEIDKEFLNLNIAQQLTLPFLLDKPASFRAKLFNKLTGNELLDKVFQSCNKEGLNLNKEIKLLDSQIIKQKEDVENCTKQYNELNFKLQKVQELYSSIEEQIIIYDELKKLAEKLKVNKEAKDFVQFKLNKIVIISDNVIKDLKEKIEQLKTMLTLKSKLTYVNQSLQEIKAKERIIPDLKLDSLIKQAKKLEELKSLNNRLVINKDEQEKIDFLNSKIKIPKVDFDTLKEDNLMLTELIKVRNHLIENKKGQENITQQTIKQSNLLDNLEKELKEIWKKCKNCPLCKQEIQNG